MPSAENALTEKFVISFFIFDYYVSFYFNSIKRRGRIEAYSIKKRQLKTNKWLRSQKKNQIYMHNQMSHYISIKEKEQLYTYG
jgi:hypothetical protein